MNAAPAGSSSSQSGGTDQTPISGSRRQISRYDLTSAVLHWLLAAIIAIQLVLGCYLIFQSRAAPGWEPFFRLHVKFGLTGALVVLGMLLVKVYRAAPTLPNGIPSWQRSLGQTVNVLLYGMLLVTPITGYVASVFGSGPAAYPVVPLPAWRWDDPALSSLFSQFHGVGVWMVTALIVIHIVLMIIYERRHPGVLSMMLPSREALPEAGAPLQAQLAEQESRRLAQRFRFLGWIAFWVQLGLGLIGLLLLVVVASSGHFSVQATTGMPGVMGAYLGAIVLLATTLAFYYCTRVARALMCHSARLPSRLRLLKFLGLLGFTGFFGMALAMTGAASSIALLVAKTVTQPPGIAITDPSRIIRALDVFVLLANFDVLVAHFLGTLLALWLLAYSIRHYRPAAPVVGDAAVPSETGDLEPPTNPCTVASSQE